jgi:hypothetical protein
VGTTASEQTYYSTCQTFHKRQLKGSAGETDKPGRIPWKKIDSLREQQQQMACQKPSKETASGEQISCKNINTAWQKSSLMKQPQENRSLVTSVKGLAGKKGHNAGIDHNLRS